MKATQFLKDLNAAIEAGDVEAADALKAKYLEASGESRELLKLTASEDIRSQLEMWDTDLPKKGRPKGSGKGRDNWKVTVGFRVDPETKRRFDACREGGATPESILLRGIEYIENDNDNDTEN